MTRMILGRPRLAQAVLLLPLNVAEGRFALAAVGALLIREAPVSLELGPHKTT